MDLTHLVNHVGQQALNLVIVNLLLASETNGGGKFSDGYAAWANRLLPILALEAAGEENLAQQVTQRNVAAPFQREVDAALDELVLAFLESKVERVELALLDTAAERQEELLQSRIRGQQFLCWQSMVGDQTTGDEVRENKSNPVSATWICLNRAAGLAYAHSLFLTASLWQRFHASVSCFSA